MSISTVTDIVGPYAISTLPQTLAVTYPFQLAADLVVESTGTTPTPVYPAVVLTLGSDYTVTGGGYNAAGDMQTGSVTILSGGAHDVQVGENIVIVRRPPQTQETSFLLTGFLTAAMIEEALDKLTTLVQALQDGVNRSVRVTDVDDVLDALTVAARASKIVGFDAAGNLVMMTISGATGATTVVGTANEIEVDQVGTIATVSLPALLVLIGKAISGGTFNGSSIGQTTPGPGKFTTLASTQAANFAITQLINTQVGGDVWLQLVAAGGKVASILFSPDNTLSFLGQGGAVPIEFLPNGSVVLSIDTAGSNGPIGQTTPAAAKFTTVAINTNANLRTTKGNFNLTVNVKDYGAAGDGTNDDTAAIGLAITGLAADHAALVFPPGKYRTTGNLAITGKTNLLVSGEAAEIFADCPAKTVTSATHATTTATVTTSAPHGFITGDSVSIRGANEAPYNGSFTITVTGLGTFTYTMGSDPGANATGTIKTQKNIQTLEIDETSSHVRVEGLHFNSSATIRGDGVHLRISASNTATAACTFEKSSGFGWFVGGDGVTGLITDTILEDCLALNTIGDGFHAGGIDGLDMSGLIADGCGDDCIGIIGYEAFAGQNLNVVISDCVVKNMQNAGGGSGSGIRVNMVRNCQITGIVADHIAGPAIRFSDSGSGHTSVYNEEVFVDDIQVRDCVQGVEAYFMARSRISRVNCVNCTAVTMADWAGFNEVSDCVSYGEGQNSITFYVPPITSFAGRNFAAHWEDIAVTNCSGSSSIADNSNCVVFMDTDASFDIGKLIITGCTAILENSGGAWIVYKGIKAGGVGKICNNTNISNTTITNAGGTAAGTIVNNN